MKQRDAIARHYCAVEHAHSWRQRRAQSVTSMSQFAKAVFGGMYSSLHTPKRARALWTSPQTTSASPRISTPPTSYSHRALNLTRRLKSRNFLRDASSRHLHTSLSVTMRLSIASMALVAAVFGRKTRVGSALIMNSQDLTLVNFDFCRNVLTFAHHPRGIHTGLFRFLWNHQTSCCRIHKSIVFHSRTTNRASGLSIGWEISR